MSSTKKPETNPASKARGLVLCCAAGAAAVVVLMLILWWSGRWQWGAFGSDYVPMAPLTAWLLLLLSSALLLRNRWPSHVAATVAAYLAIFAVTAFSLPVLTGWGGGIVLGVERLLANTDATAGGVAVGRMSLMTAAGLLAAALALLTQLPPLDRRRQLRQLSAVVALLLILLGFAAILGYAGGAPFLQRSGWVPMALVTAMALVLLGAGLLFAAGLDRWPLQMVVFDTSSAPASFRRFGRMLLAMLSFMLVAIGGGGFLLLKHLDAAARKDAMSNMAAIADLKTQRILHWHQERMGDASVFFNAPFLADRVREFVTDPSRESACQEVTHWLALVQRFHDYEWIALLDSRPAFQLSAPSDVAIDAVDLREAKEALDSRQIIFTDLHLDDDGRNAHLDLVVPLLTRDRSASGAQPQTVLPAVSGERPVGAIIMRVNLQKSFYPIIQSWPTSSRTAETLLVRREGNDVLFLNELRHRKGTALALRIPISTEDLPAAMAVRGEVGEVEGVDYRGVPVLAAIRAVPGTPWFIVAKVDQEEVYAVLRQQTRAVWASVGLLVIVSCLGIALLWRQRDTHYLRGQLQNERQRVALAKRVEHLMKGANDAILLTDKDWRILEANDRAVEFYGYSSAELLQMRLTDLRAPQARAVFEPQVDWLKNRSGAVFESVNRRKDGSTFPVEISDRIVDIGGVHYGFTVIRDITERKAQEREIARMTRLYATLSQVNQAIVRVQSEDELAREVCRVTIKFGGFKLAWIGRHDPQTDDITPLASEGEPREFVYNFRHNSKESQQHRCLCGPVIRENRPCIANDLRATSEMRDWQSVMEQAGVRAAAVFPVRAEGKVWGIFGVYAGEPQIFQHKEIALLEEAAMDIGFALDHLAHEKRRKQAEAALAVANERLRNTLANMAEGYYALDRDWRVVAVNDMAEKHFGKPAVDLIGGTFEQATQGRIPDNVREGIRQVIASGKPQHFEVESKVRPGTWAVDYIYPCDGGVEVYFTDITERKRTEEEREVMVRLLGLFNAPNNLHELMQAVTSLLREWFGCDAIGIRLRDGDDYPYFETRGFPEEFVRAENWLCLRDDAGQVVRDGEGNPVLDCMCGNVLCRRFNPAKPFFTARGSFWTNCTTELLASTTEADRQARTRNRCNGEGYESVTLVALRVGETTYGLLQINDKRRDRFTPQSIALLERLADNLAIAIAHRQAQEDIRRLNAELEQRVRDRTAQLEAANRELEAFSYSVSHDLRTPLRGITGYASILTEDFAQQFGEEGRRLLGVISSEAARMGQLIDDLLQFSRVGRQTMQRVEVDMNAMARRAFDECVMQAPGRDIRLKLHPLPPAMADPALLPHVWGNLLSNAIKYTRTRPVAEIEVTGQVKDGELIYCVKDNGVGFDMQYAHKLFVVFQRLHSEAEFEGTGVGLALVQRIVARHGGNVWAEATLNEGAVFYFALPADQV